MQIKIGFDFTGWPCYLAVKASGEIVEVEYCQEVDHRGSISGRFIETSSRREFQAEELRTPSEDEVNLFLLCPDVYMDNLKNSV